MYPPLPRGSPPDTPRGSSTMLRLATLLLLAAALAVAERPRRAEMSPVPFVMGSRYGRSSERVMAPRNDRFFMGSRYGKRSGGGEEAGSAGGGCRLVCVPLRPALEPQRAGVQSQLYRCVRAPHRDRYVSRSLSDVLSVRAGDASDSDE